MPMTPRERWLAVMRRQIPDRTPTDYWATPETSARLVAALGAPSLSAALDRLHVDYLVHAAPRYVGPPLSPGVSVFGVVSRDIDTGSGVYAEAVSHPLAGCASPDEIEAAYRWPDPDWWDYSVLPDQVRGHEDRAVRGGGSEPFLIYKELRGDVQAMLDLIEHPDIVEYCLEKLFDLAYTNTLRIYEAIPGRVELSYVAEDMGAQADLMISPRHLRRFLFPGMRRMIDLAHSAGVYVFHHNDGNITRILPELVDLGIDLLNPIQWRAGASTPPWGVGASTPPSRFALPKGSWGVGASTPPCPSRRGVVEIGAPCTSVSPPGRPEGRAVSTPNEGGMNRAMLKARYGDRVVFHGAMDNQYTLPFGTVEEVRCEVRENLAILGAGGGYILAPCHNLQALTPVENIVAMYETAWQEG